MAVASLQLLAILERHIVAHIVASTAAALYVRHMGTKRMFGMEECGYQALVDGCEQL
jgi:hypothetical protein